MFVNKTDKKDPAEAGKTGMCLWQGKKICPLMMNNKSHLLHFSGLLQLFQMLLVVFLYDSTLLRG